MGDVTVASTTDTQDQVNQAAGGVQETETEERLIPTGDAQVESGEQEAAPEPEKAVEEKPKVPRGVEKRIDKLTREKNELAQRLAAIEARQAGQVEEEKQAPVVPTEVAAKFDTFDAWSQKQLEAGKSASIDDFLEERDVWKDARREQQEERQAVAEMQAEIAETYNEKVETFKAEHEDWEETVNQPIDLPVGVGPAILELDNGPEVAYYLGKNPQIAKKLNEMSPFLAVAEVGRIAARLEKPQEETPGISRGPDRAPIVSKAPAPIKQLTGHGVKSTVDLNDPNLSFDEYRKIRDAQEKARYRR